jgi:hypothetical protein
MEVDHLALRNFPPLKGAPVKIKCREHRRARRRKTHFITDEGGIEGCLGVD